MTSPSISIGLQLGANPPAALNRALVYFARISGFNSVWVLDHFQGLIPSAIWDQKLSWTAARYTSPHELFEYQVLLGYLASSAGRLQLGVGVTEAIRRHPVLIAQAMLTLAHMTRRSPILGIGAGERENIEPYGLRYSQPVGHLEEALQIIRLCFSHEKPLNFQGKHYQLDHAVMDLRAPRNRTPEIWLGGRGPRMLRLVGQYGDGWYPSEVSCPEDYAEKLKVIRMTAQEAGRDPQAITPALFRLVAVAPTERKARAMLDSRAGRLLALGVPADEWRKVGAQHPFGEHFRGAVDWIPEQYNREMLEDAMALVPAEMLGAGLIWGTPEQVANKLRAFCEVGVRHIVLCPASALLSRQAAIYGLLAVRKIAAILQHRR